MSWSQAEERSKQAGSGGKYLSLKNDGDKFVGAFIGEPYSYELFYNAKKNGYEPYTDEHRKRGDTVTVRFVLNVMMQDGSVKISEMNNSTFQSVLDVRKKYGLDKWFFEVKRKGAKGDTKTTYTVLPDTKLEDADLKKLAAAHPFDLEKESKNRSDESGGGAGDEKTDMNSHGKGGAEAAMISKEDAEALIKRVKILPKDKIDLFLGKFEIRQVKLLPAAKLVDALAMVAQLEGNGAAPSPPPAATDDPFA